MVSQAKHRKLKFHSLLRQDPKSLGHSAAFLTCTNRVWIWREGILTGPPVACRPCRRLLHHNSGPHRRFLTLLLTCWWLGITVLRPRNTQKFQEKHRTTRCGLYKMFRHSGTQHATYRFTVHSGFESIVITTVPCNIL